MMSAFPDHPYATRRTTGLRTGVHLLIRIGGLLLLTSGLIAPRVVAQPNDDKARPALEKVDRRVAITFDDLPFVHASEPGTRNGVENAITANRAIVGALDKSRIPAIGFVVENRVRSLGKEGLNS